MSKRTSAPHFYRCGTIPAESAAKPANGSLIRSRTMKGDAQHFPHAESEGRRTSKEWRTQREPSRTRSCILVSISSLRCPALVSYLLFCAMSVHAMFALGAV